MPSPHRTAFAFALLVLVGARVAGAVPLQRLHVLADPQLGGFEDTFGRSLMSIGSLLVVGAPGEGSGIVYVFDTALLATLPSDMTANALVTTLRQPPPLFDGTFGRSLAALNGDVVVGTRIGEAYRLELTGATLVRTFVDPNPVANEDHAFGSPVVTVGPAVVIGAPYDSASAPYAGAAYVIDGTTGELLRTLTPPMPQPGDFLGASMAAVGTTIAVSAPTHLLNLGLPARPGRVELFDASSGAWVRTLMAPAPQPDDYFGGMVQGGLAALGNELLVGAPGAQGGPVYAFDVTTGALTRTIANPSPSEFNAFGFAITPFGDAIAVGAPSADVSWDSGLYPGAMYVVDAATGALRQTFGGGDYLESYGRAIAPLGGGLAVSAGSDGGRVEILSPCGDGIVDVAEQCDDGNAVNGDGCDDNCRTTGCGNGRVSAGEDCDDGNLEDTDACTHACRAYACGDGIVATNLEQCDDGNLVDGDGCDADCQRSVCVGGGRVRGGRLVLKNLGPPYGDEEVRFTGTLVFDAALALAFDPSATGAQVIVDERGAGALVWPQELPPGGPGSGCDPLHDGWTANANRRVHVYRSVGPPGCVPDFHYPQTTLELQRRRTRRPRVHFDLRQTSATVFAPLSGALRGGVVLGANAEAGTAGACGIRPFRAKECRFNRRRTRLVCRASG